MFQIQRHLLSPQYEAHQHSGIECGIGKIVRMKNGYYFATRGENSIAAAMD
eukprot:SAG31_NODE_16963_length_688_cov_2.747029_1_plen_51_part_00